MATNTKRTAPAVDDDEFVPVTEIRKSSRGRTKELDQALIAKLAQVTEDRAWSGRAHFTDGGKNPITDKAEQSKVGALIRKNWREAQPGRKCSVNWHPEGFPQVTIAKPKA